MYTYDKRIVMTLDAGGTNFVFSAIRSNREVIEPITYPACADNLEACLRTIAAGFTEVRKQLETAPVAISFAFPGPADYQGGVIGDLPNFPSFRGGVPLGAYLQEIFGIPVFINNDGNLFAYGEALAGFLPEVNAALRQSGTTRRYRNLLGITLGTGFGAGVVINRQLLLGDNGCGGDVWCFRNKFEPELIAEESVSIRAIKHYYQEYSSMQHSCIELTPYDIFLIADGQKEGDREAALRSFATLGEAAGDILAQAITIVDGLIVIGGGLTGASKYFMPALLGEIRRQLGMRSGEQFGRVQMEVLDYDDDNQRRQFLTDKSRRVTLPAAIGTSTESVTYKSCKEIAISISKLGASRAIAFGAYAYALSQLDSEVEHIDVP